MSKNGIDWTNSVSLQSKSNNQYLGINYIDTEHFPIKYFSSNKHKYSKWIFNLLNYYCYGSKKNNTITSGDEIIIQNLYIMNLYQNPISDPNRWDPYNLSLQCSSSPISPGCNIQMDIKNCENKKMTGSWAIFKIQKWDDVNNKLSKDGTSINNYDTIVLYNKNANNGNGLYMNNYDVNYWYMQPNTKVNSENINKIGFVINSS